LVLILNIFDLGKAFLKKIVKLKLEKIMKKISKVLIENALERDEIRSIKGGSGATTCMTMFDCQAWEVCCKGIYGGRGVCQRWC
jgi:hypothetical protein